MEVVLLRLPHTTQDTPPSTPLYLELLFCQLIQHFEHFLRNVQFSAEMGEFRKGSARISFYNHQDNPLNFQSCYLQVSLNISSSHGNSVPLKVHQGEKANQPTD